MISLEVHGSGRFLERLVRSACAQGSSHMGIQKLKSIHVARIDPSETKVENCQKIA